MRRPLLSGWREDLDWLIIGERPNGERSVIEDAPSQEEAERRRELLLAHLEGYAQIMVEPLKRDHTSRTRKVRKVYR